MTEDIKTTNAPHTWTKEEIEKIEKLIKNHTAREAGEMINRTKNAVLGVLYREKVKRGYVPPLDSKYARIRKYRKGFN